MSAVPIPASFNGDAIVKGSLREGANLQISGSLGGGGAIEAVQIKTRGSVKVKGGVIVLPSHPLDLTKEQPQPEPLNSKAA